MTDKELEAVAKAYATKNVFKNQSLTIPAGTVVDPDRYDGFMAGYRHRDVEVAELTKQVERLRSGLEQFDYHPLARDLLAKYKAVKT